jgi:hypothetical protein
MVLRKATVGNWSEFVRKPDGADLAAAAAAATAWQAASATPSPASDAGELADRHGPELRPGEDTAGAGRVDTGQPAAGRAADVVAVPGTAANEPPLLLHTPASAPAASLAPAAPAPAVEEADDGRFYAAREFQGSRPGFVFKAGARGLGYYLDEQTLPAPPAAGGAEQPGTTSQSHDAAVLQPLAAAEPATAAAVPETAAPESAAARKDPLPGLVFTNTLMFQLD